MVLWGGWLWCCDVRGSLYIIIFGLGNRLDLGLDRLM